jgi:hypothetical protein
LDIPPAAAAAADAVEASKLAAAFFGFSISGSYSDFGRNDLMPALFPLLPLLLLFTLLLGVGFLFTILPLLTADGLFTEVYGKVDNRNKNETKIKDFYVTKKDSSDMKKVNVR